MECEGTEHIWLVWIRLPQPVPEVIPMVLSANVRCPYCRFSDYEIDRKRYKV